MTASDLTLSVNEINGTQEVYARRNWIDSEWELQPGLQADSMEFCAMPSIGRAVLFRKFGLGMFPGDTEFSYKPALDIKNWFVKIVYTPAPTEEIPVPSAIQWYGVVAIEELHRADRYSDDGTLKLSGSQTFHCMELGYLLDRKPILNGFFKSSEGVKEVGAAPVFNESGIGNLHPDNPGDDKFYFCERSNPAELDAPQDIKAIDWSTKTITKYLLDNFIPSDGLGNKLFNVEIINATQLPDWDKPVLPQHGQTTWELLCQLIDRRRCLGAFLRVRPFFLIPGVPLLFEAVELVVFTHVDSEIALGENGETLPANLNQYNLEVDRRPDFGTAMKLSVADQYERVIVEGRPRRSVCTLNMVEEDEQVTGDWKEEESDAYNNGASDQADYGSLSSAMAQARNNAVRTSPMLSHVYARFRLHDEWDGKSDGGAGGSPVPVLVDDENPNEVYGNWPKGWRFSPSLPLYVGVNYSETRIEDGDIPEHLEGQVPFMPPSCYFPTLEDSEQWFEASGNALANLVTADDERTWSLRFQVEDEKPRFWLGVVGSYQHVIAGDEFEPLDEDVELEHVYDWRDALVTICIEENRKTRVQWPVAEIENGAFTSALREKHVDLGDGFCLDYVAPETVVGIDPETGGLLRSESGGFVRDDRPKMTALAKQLYNFYSRIRRVISIEKMGVAAELWLGGYITQLGLSSDPSELITPVGTVVTQVAITFPPNASPPILRIETSHGELDALVLSVRRAK